MVKKGPPMTSRFNRRISATLALVTMSWACGSGPSLGASPADGNAGSEAVDDAGSDALRAGLMQQIREQFPGIEANPVPVEEIHTNGSFSEGPPVPSGSVGPYPTMSSQGSKVHNLYIKLPDFSASNPIKQIQITETDGTSQKRLLSAQISVTTEGNTVKEASMAIAFAGWSAQAHLRVENGKLSGTTTGAGNNALASNASNASNASKIALKKLIPVVELLVSDLFQLADDVDHARTEAIFGEATNENGAATAETASLSPLPMALVSGGAVHSASLVVPLLQGFLVENPGSPRSDELAVVAYREEEMRQALMEMNAALRAAERHQRRNETLIHAFLNSALALSVASGVAMIVLFRD